MMFHSSSVHMPNRRGRPRCGFRSFMPTTSFSRQDSKEPLRRGILFSSVAFVLLLTGVMLTWLGLNEPFSDKVSVTGPLLIAVALVVLFLSFRQFMVARERNRAVNGTVQLDTISTGGVTTVIVDDEEGNRATVLVETWDTQEPLREETRNTGELAPPAYIDISQSCSSMCPSFVSHEDHNEAPPTYEETCGTVYRSGSENSLSHPGSHRNSIPDCTHPPVAPVAPDGGEDWRKLRESPRSSLLSPAHSGALMAQAAVRRQRQTLPPLTFSESSDQQPMLPVVVDQENTAGNVCIGFSSPENLSPSSQLQSPDSGHLAGTAPPTPVPPSMQQCHDTSWSRRSFSSIPSYTCLLGKSGEVSAQIFDTSSIIQGMMPHSVQHSGTDHPQEDSGTRNTLSPTADTTGTNNILPGHSAIPARSHSLSSVLPLRVGVPYKVCLVQEQPKSPLRPHVISSPLLSSPQHSFDDVNPHHSFPQQQPTQQLSSHTSHTDAKRSSTGLPVPSSVGGTQCQHQGDEESSGHPMKSNLQTSKKTSNPSIDESCEVWEETPSYQCTSRGDDHNKMSTTDQCTSGEVALTKTSTSDQSTAGDDDHSGMSTSDQCTSEGDDPTRLSTKGTGSDMKESTTVTGERRSPVLGSQDIQETI